MPKIKKLSRIITLDNAITPKTIKENIAMRSIIVNRFIHPIF